MPTHNALLILMQGKRNRGYSHSALAKTASPSSTIMYQPAQDALQAEWLLEMIGWV